jgi:aminopeptidase
MFERYIERLYLINMNLQPSEGLLLITDDTKDYLADLLLEFYNVGSGLAKWVKKVCYTVVWANMERNLRKRFGE